jgi:hypothetical protein
VVFNAAGSESFAEVVGIDVSERDFADQPGGLPLEVAGESCIPGIDAENTAAIFEEHTIRWAGLEGHARAEDECLAAWPPARSCAERHVTCT